MYAKFIKTIDTGDLPGIGSEARTSVLPIAVLEQTIHAFDLNNSTIELARSAAFLWHDHLDASHDVSQDLSSAEGSFLHGIMHRREPDYSNAKYWFRRAGNHSSYPVLSSKVEDYLKTIEKQEVFGYLVSSGCWDPFAFVDAVENAKRTGENIEILQNIQRLEFESLVESFLV